jgi:hypothetical protein
MATMLLFCDPQKERGKEGKNNDANISTKFNVLLPVHPAEIPGK